MVISHEYKKYKPVSVQIMAWHYLKQRWTSLLTHIWGIRPRWGKECQLVALSYIHLKLEPNKTNLFSHFIIFLIIVTVLLYCQNCSSNWMPLASSRTLTLHQLIVLFVNKLESCVSGSHIDIIIPNTWQMLYIVVLWLVAVRHRMFARYCEMCFHQRAYILSSKLYYINEQCVHRSWNIAGHFTGVTVVL